jgi:hypothetical protein
MKYALTTFLKILSVLAIAGIFGISGDYLSKIGTYVRVTDEFGQVRYYNKYDGRVVVESVRLEKSERIRYVVGCRNSHGDLVEFRIYSIELQPGQRVDLQVGKGYFRAVFFNQDYVSATGYTKPMY